jgi:chromosome segregation ATPase
MIFTSDKNGLDGIINKFGIFNKSFNNIKRDLSSGHGLLNSIFVSSFTSNDINSIKEYITQIKAGVPTGEAWSSTMKGCTVTAKQHVLACKNDAKALEELSATASAMVPSVKAADIALKGLALAGNILVSLVISKVISTVYEMAQASDTVGKAAKEAADEFSSASSDIESYKKQVEDLYSTINNSSSSIEDVTNARKQLLSIQDEMISKFGSEKEVIDLVTQAVGVQTEAIGGQTKAFEELSRKKWLETLNDFNKSQNFGTDLANGFQGYSTNLDRAKDEYFNYNKGVLDFGFVGENLPEFKQALKSLDVDMDDTFIRVNGNATEVYNTLLEIENLAKKYNVDEDFQKSVGIAANQAKEISDKYKDFLDQYTLNEEILPDETYKKDYKSLTEKYTAYQKAFEDGDEEAQNEAIQQYAETLSSAAAKALENGDEEVADYFKSMYPTIQNEVSSWLFEINFKPNVNGLKDTVEQNLKVFTDKGYTTEQLADFDPSKSTDEELNNAYNNLQEALKDYGLSVTDLISTFEKLGLIVSQSKKQLLDKYSGNKDDIEKMDSGDLEIAYKVDNKTIKTWDQLIQKIREYKQQAEAASKVKPFTEQEMISKINGLSEGFEELDKIMNSMNDKDKPFDYALLDNKKFKEIFQDCGNEYTSFVKKVSDSPKDVKGCQDAFNDLVTKWINSTDIIKGLSDDTADLTTAMLSNMGVSNAEELVTEALAAKHAQLAAQKYIDANASNDLKDATLDEYVQFLNEASGSEVSKAALAQLELAKLAVNNVKIDTASDIEQVIALANAAGASAANLLELQRAESILGQVEAGTLDMDVPGNNMLLDYANNTKNKLNNNTFKFEYEELDPEKFKKAVYDGGVKTNTPSKGSSGSKGAKENSTIDWIKRSAELLERESTRLQTAIDDTWKAYTGLSQADIERVQELFSMNLTPNSDEVNELLDYADKLGVSIGELQDLANNNGLESRQSLLEQLIDVDKQRLDQGIDSLNYYKNSYEEYVAKVPEYRDKIENGGIDIESFSGDEKTKIENAMNAYDSYLNQKKTNLELSNTIRDNELKYYTIAIDEIDKKNARLSNSNDLIQKQIDLLNTQGVTVSSSMYDQLISNTEGQIGYQQEKLQKQKDQLIKAITEEGLKVGSDKWYELNDEIMSTEGSIKDLEKAQAEYEKQLRELPITNLEKLGTIYQNILDTIQNWGAEMEASGKTLNADYYQKLINNANTSISNYKEEIEAIQDVMSDYDPGTDNWNEMNDKLQQCNSSISSLVQNMHKWNEELLNLPIQKISDASDSLSKIVDGLNDVKSEHETVISAVTGAISDEIDRLNDEKEAYEDTINDQKEALQDRMDLLDKQNEKLKLQAQYEQALYDLENATTQKTEKVIRNGELTYEANADNLRNAQETVQDALAALKKQELQDQMDALDDALDDYNDKLQDTLDSLQKISDKWSEIASKKEQADNEKTATDILGKNWKDKVLSGNDNDIFQMFSKLYTDNVDQINKYQEQIDSTEHISSLIQEYIDSYKAGTLTYEEAQAGIHDLVSQMNQKMSAMDNLQNIYNYMGKVYDTAADGNSVFAGIQKAFSESGNQLISSLEQYQANAGLISESMSSWQQLTNNVESIKDILEDVKDNLKDTERDRDDDKDSGSKSHVTGKHSSKSVYGSSGFSAEKHHSGVFSGAVGSSSADKTDKIKVLEAEKLEPNEIPAVLERGEMVFTPEQMEKLVASFSATAYVPDNSWIKNMYPSATVNTKPNVVNVSVGDVKLTDVRDVDGFAKAMGRDFVPLARQALARF